MTNVIADIMPTPSLKMEKELVAVDTGAIRNEIVAQLQAKGYTVTEENSYLFVDGPGDSKIEFSCSDSLIADMTVYHGFKLQDFVNLIIEQYDYLVTNQE